MGKYGEIHKCLQLNNNNKETNMHVVLYNETYVLVGLVVNAALTNIPALWRWSPNNRVWASKQVIILSCASEHTRAVLYFEAHA